MPIKYDKRPGSANKKQRRRNGGLPEPQKQPAPSPLEETMRVRMLREINCKRGIFAPGQVIELPIAVARSWIGFGFVEQDKMLNGAPEKK